MSHRLIGRVPRTLRGWHQVEVEAAWPGRFLLSHDGGRSAGSRAAAVSCLRLRSSPVIRPRQSRQVPAEFEVRIRGEGAASGSLLRQTTTDYLSAIPA